LSCIHPMSLTISGTLMTEPAFIFWTFTALLLTARNANFCFTLLWTAFAAWIRPEGAILMLIAAAMGYSWNKSAAKEKILLISGAFIFVSLPYIRNTLISGRPASYFTELPVKDGLLESLLFLSSNTMTNLVYYFKTIPCYLFAVQPHGGGFFLYFFCAAIWGISAYGIHKMWSSDDSSRIRAGYMCAFLLGHVFWVNQSVRYIFPVLPIIYEAILTGLPKNRKYAVAFAVACFMVLSVLDFKVISDRFRGIKKSPPEQTINWIISNTSPGDTISATYRESAFIMTGRTSTGYMYIADPNEWYRNLTDSGIKLVWVDKSRPLINNIPARKKLIQTAHAAIEQRLTNKKLFINAHTNIEEKQYLFRPADGKAFSIAYARLKKILGMPESGKTKQALKELQKLESEQAPVYRLDFYIGTTAMLAGDDKLAFEKLTKAAAEEPWFETAANNLKIIKNRQR